MKVPDGTLDDIRRSTSCGCIAWDSRDHRGQWVLCIEPCEPNCARARHAEACVISVGGRVLIILTDHEGTDHGNSTQTNR